MLANPAIGYIGSQQRYDVLAPAFQNQSTALALSPILSQTLPVAANFEYDYTQQGNFGIERQLGTSVSLGADYTYTHGAHLLRPRNINQADFDRIVAYTRATAVCPNLPGVTTNGCSNPAYGGAGGSLAGLWDALGGASATSLAPLGQLLFNQFRATGPELHLGEHRVKRRSLQASHGRFGASVQSPQRSGQCGHPLFQREAIRVLWRFGLSRSDPDLAQAFHPELSTVGILDAVALHRRLDGSADPPGSAGQQEPAAGSQQFEFRPAAPLRCQWRRR